MDLCHTFCGGNSSGASSRSGVVVFRRIALESVRGAIPCVQPWAEAWDPRRELLTAKSAERKKNAEKTGNPGNLLGAPLGRTLAFFVGTCLSGLLSADGVGILGRGKENGAVVTKFALAAS